MAIGLPCIVWMDPTWLLMEPSSQRAIHQMHVTPYYNSWKPLDSEHKKEKHQIFPPLQPAQRVPTEMHQQCAQENEADCFTQCQPELLSEASGEVSHEDFRPWSHVMTPIPQSASEVKLGRLIFWWDEMFYLNGLSGPSWTKYFDRNQKTSSFLLRVAYQWPLKIEGLTCEWSHRSRFQKKWWHLALPQKST